MGGGPARNRRHERVDHRHDELPPRFAETGVALPGYLIESKGVQLRVMAGLGEGTKGTKGTKAATTGVRRLLAGTLPEAKIAARRLHMRQGCDLEPVDTDSDEVRTALNAGRSSAIVADDTPAGAYTCARDE